MSEENVELMEAIFAAINRGDLNDFLELAHPEIEFHSLIAEAEGQTFRGHDGVREWWHSVIDALDIAPNPAAIESFRDRGITCLRIVAKIDDVEVPQTMWLAWRVRDGRLAWWKTYRTESEALEAAGLSE